MRNANRPRPNPSSSDIMYMELQRPIPNKYGSVIPHPSNYDNYGRPPPNDYMLDGGETGYDNRPPKRPNFYLSPSDPDDPNDFYGKPARPNKPIYSDNDKPDRPLKRPLQDSVGVFSYDRPSRPHPPPDFYNDKKPTSKPNNNGGYDNQPNDSSGAKLPYRPGTSDKGVHGNNNGNDYNNKGSNSKPIVSHSIGNHGERITSIITELKDGKWFLIIT